ncbi:hypothetical protein NB532_16105 [Vibrio antiquarius]|uniref:hypothetical protein n=1 Tax=Vibrio antiquarius (strain Ex25) TaxID=150340 RepID=UPI002658CDB9|nr:hypothetical protein [Vibrio antiquarius]MCR9477923.1 hypothetical protein [Vibrio antiquarius]
MKLINVTLFCIVTSILMKPLYLWSSGLPQISDFLSILGILCFIVYSLKNKVCFSNDKKMILNIFCFFVLYTWVINISLSIIYSNPEAIKTSIYYTYNLTYAFVLIITIETIYSKNNNILMVNHFVLLSLFIGLILVSLLLILPPDYGTRYSLTFNNPNQLASYVMLISVILVFFSIDYRRLVTYKYKTLTLIALMLMIIVSIASQSVAAIFAVVMASILFVNFMYVGYQKVVLFFLVFILFIYFISSNIDYYFSEVMVRMDDKISTSSIDEFFKERGYDRIFNHLDLIIFGAGEGIYSRLNSFIIDDYYQLELHSTFGNILFSYGLFGFLLFLLVIIRMCCKNLNYMFILMFMMPYLLTHNLIRQPLFWFFLMVPLILLYNEKQNRIVS